MTGLYYTNNRG